MKSHAAVILVHILVCINDTELLFDIGQEIGNAHRSFERNLVTIGLFSVHKLGAILVSFHLTKI